MRLQGKAAVVTGGGRGIGEAIALAFAREGASVVLAARSRVELEAVADGVRLAGSAAHVVVGDVSHQIDAERIAAEAASVFGKVDVLVNCAGVYGPIGLLHEVDVTEWVRALHVNLLGTLYCSRAVLPLMIARRAGKVINLSGGGATAPLPRFSAYAVSKAAVVRLTETMAEEVAPFGIQVNAIAPGAVDTRLQDAVLSAGERAGPLYERIRTMRQSGAGGTPVELPADLAVFLASDDSADLSGRLIAAPYDDWRQWDAQRIAAMKHTPWYTLRRIDPHTVGPLKDQYP